MFSWNIDLFLYLHSFAFQSVWFDALIVFFARQLQWFVILGSLVFFIKRVRAQTPYFYLRMWKGIQAYKSVCATWIVTYGVKLATAIPRPFEGLSDITPLFLYSGGDSFPSGHAALFSSLATVVYMKQKKIGILFFVVFLVISIARIMAGIHYPIDIIAGMLIGTILTYLIEKRYGTH